MATGRTRQRDRNGVPGRRDEVFAVAARLFNEQGYRGTSIEDLTNELGFTKAALYHYVKSKQQLLEELARQVGRELVDSVADGYTGRESPADRLREFARHHVATVAANRAVFAVTTRERSELSTQLLSDLEELERQYVGRLTEIVAAQPTTRRSRPSPSVGSHLLLGMLGSIVDWFRPGERMSTDDVADEIVDLFLNGIASDRAAMPAVRRDPLPRQFERISVGNGDRREEIVGIAAELFHRQGYEATTMQDIADALDVTKAALYYYVSGKQELLQEIIRRTGFGLLDAARASAEGQDEPVALARLVRLHLIWIHQKRTVYSVFLTSQSSLDEEALQELRQGEAEYVALYRALLQSGVEDGAFRPITPTVFLSAVLGSLNGTLRWFQPVGPLTIDDLADIIDDIIFRGFAPVRKR